MRYLTLLLLTLTCSTSFAYDVLRDNIYFNLNKEERTATVTYRKIVPGKSRTEYYDDIRIPETIKVKGERYLVTAIGDSAFFGSDEIVSIQLPCSITRIGKSAFEDFRCRYGESHLYGSWCSITSIGERAFANSTLKVGYMGDHVTYVGKEAFLNSAINAFIINENGVQIGEAAFKGCERMEALDIRDLRKWCDMDFVSMFSNPLYMAHNIYKNLRKDPMMSHLDSLMTTLSIPEGITALKPYVFTRANIVKLLLPDSMREIGPYAFYECEKLRILHLPASLEKIGTGAFSGCLQLQVIYLDNPDIIIEPANFPFFNGELIVKPGMTEKCRQNPIWKNCTIIER